MTIDNNLTEAANAAQQNANDAKPTPAKKSPAKKSPAKKSTSPKVVNVATDAFARTFYPNAKSPAKSLRARIRKNADKFADVLIANDTTKYAIRDTKSARDAFAKLMS